MKNGGRPVLVLRILVVALGVMLLVPAVVQAQTASVSGTVLDPQGAAVPGASVKAVNTATNAERYAETTETGLYRLGELVPSTYVITIDKSGFKTVKFENVTLTVDQALTLNATLEISAVTATVEVNAGAVAPVDTETPALSNVVDQQHITELPLILRDPYQLVLLSPGVSQSDDFGGASVNGARSRNNNFLLDGVDNNDAEVPGGLSGATAQNPDSTQEFRVITNNFAPEFGRNTGAIIDVISKSGTNQYHGNLFWFGRYNALGARDFFNHQVDPVTGKVAPPDPYVRNIYGASFGGPIKKDRTFFFMNYEGHRFVTALTNSSTVPTEAFKSGMFTYTNPATGQSQAIDVSMPGSANNAFGLVRDPVIQKIFKLYPAPNTVNADGISGQLFFPSVSREKDEDATIKIDHRLTTNNNLTARYVFNWFSDPNSDHADFLPGGIGSANQHAKTQSASLALTSTLSPTLINELRVGSNRINAFFGCNGVGLFDSFGFNDPFGRGADFNLPGFSGFGCQDLGDSNSQSRKAGTYQTRDNMSWSWRQHTFKWGAEFRDIYANSFTDFGSRQTFSMNVNTQAGVSPLSGIASGVDTQALEDMVGGLQGFEFQQLQTQFFPSPTTQSSGDNLSFRQREMGVYWQDVWKIKSNFTLTYGLRWEYYGVPYETHNEIATLLQNPNAILDPSGFFTFSSVGRSGAKLYENDFRDFQPRLGFAWDPFKTGRTSVRGGIGVFNDRVYGNLASDVRGNPPFQPTAICQPLFGVATVASCPGSQIQQVFQQIPLSGTTPSPLVFNGTGLFPDLFDQHLKGPRSVNWNIGVERELLHNLTVQANYVGTHSTRNLRVVDANPPQPDRVAALLAFCVPGNPANMGFNTPSGQCDQTTPQFGNLYFGAENGVIPFDPVNNNAFFNTFTDTSIGRGFYDALQLQVNEQNFHGLQVSGAYTWSHAIDDSSDPLVPTAHNGNFPVNSLNLRAEKGNSGFDARHRAVINFIYLPPIGRGRARYSSGVVGRILEGWELTGIATFQSGLPYDIFGTVDSLYTSFADRATVVGSLTNPPGTDKTHTGPPLSGLANGAFLVPSNVGRNAFVGPGTNNWDMSVAKTTALTERFKLQMRIESYNLFNRTHFAKPDNNIGDSNFGISTNQVGQNDGTTGARQIQFGLKLNF
jgi:hypothetical protein